MITPRFVNTDGSKELKAAREFIADIYYITLLFGSNLMKKVEDIYGLFIHLAIGLKKIKPYDWSCFLFPHSWLIL